jgi:hypothetical protein
MTEFNNKLQLYVDPESPQGEPYYFGRQCFVDEATHGFAAVWVNAGGKQVVHPETLEPLTPVFDDFVRIGKDYLVAERDSSYFLICPNPMQTDIAIPNFYTYPPELDRDNKRGNIVAFTLGLDDATAHERINRIHKPQYNQSYWGYDIENNGGLLTAEPIEDPGIQDRIIIARKTPDLFHFNDVEGNPNMLLAGEVYEGAMEKLVKYLRKHKELRKFLSEDVSEIALPPVRTSGNVAMRLTFTSTDQHTHLILDSMLLDGTLRASSGFHLTRHPDGDVVVVPVDQKQDVPIDSPLYREQLIAAKKALEYYFSRLKTQQTLGMSTLNLSFEEAVQQLSAQERTGRVAKALKFIHRK